MSTARELVEEYMPNLVADPRFEVVDEDPRKWGFIAYGAASCEVVVSTHHTGKYVKILRNAPMRDIVDFAYAEALYAYLEQARPPWADEMEGALRYLDAHLEDVLRVTATEQEWDRFRADARQVFKETMGN